MLSTVPIVQLITGKSVDTDKLPAGWNCRYGRVFKPGITKLQIELMAFRDDWQPPFGLGRYEHAKRLIETIWPEYIWNKWSEKIWRALCSNDLVGLMGCAGSTKSRNMAMYAELCWWSAPQDTAVAVTSTDIEGAKNRVWGEIKRCHNEAQFVDDEGNRLQTPGVPTGQPARVNLKNSVDGIGGAGQQSILLVAAGNAFTDSALRTLQGLHNKFVLLILDELQDLTEAIIGDPLLSNLRRNERFQLIAAGNIGDADDPLGKLCRPVTADGNGYDDVNEDTETWEIGRLDMKGVCVRLDAEKTPNYDRKKAGLPELRFLPTVAEVEAERAAYNRGEREAGAYYRQWKAFIAPKGAEDGRYAPAVLTKFDASKPAVWATAGGYLTVVGCDPAYSAGGDRFVLYPVRYGLAANGIWTLEFQEPRLLQHDVADDTVRNYAMVAQAKRICVDELGVAPSNFAVDNSGENPLGDIFAKEWSDEILRVNFQGKASELPVSLTDRRPSSHVYYSKGAELWGALATFIRHNQVRGIGPQHAKELAARRTDTSGAGGKLKVEDKAKMRKRLGFSPDVADAANVSLALLRERHGAIAGADAAVIVSPTQQQYKSPLAPVRLTSNLGIARVRSW